jgi:hypothetical protein
MINNYHDEPAVQAEALTIEEVPGKLFPLGMVVMTPRAAALLVDASIHTREIIERHQSGDWGDLYPEDCTLNNDALKNGARILSAYKLKGGGRLWVITEADRSVTTLLLPCEY